MKHLLSILILLISISTAHSDKLFLECKKNGYKSLDIIIDPIVSPNNGWENYSNTGDERQHNSRVNGIEVDFYDISKDEIVIYNLWVTENGEPLEERMRINRNSGRLYHSERLNSEYLFQGRAYECTKLSSSQF